MTTSRSSILICSVHSDLMILNKIDLLPYVPFNVDRCLAYARQVNSHIRVIQVSALRGDGLEEWYDWIRECFSALIE